jgi:hypothetical protein
VNKINRNDPCHCGSGKKYKKCCYGADQDKRRPVNLKKKKIQFIANSLAGSITDTFKRKVTVVKSEQKQEKKEDDLLVPLDEVDYRDEETQNNEESEKNEENSQ